MAAGITSAGASQAGDMMQDLKTGRMLGARHASNLLPNAGILSGIPIATGCTPCTPTSMTLALMK